MLYASALNQILLQGIKDFSKLFKTERIYTFYFVLLKLLINFH